MKDTRDGWIWQEVGNSGYWVKDDVKNAHKHKKPFFCPHCKKICGSIDSDYTDKYGICWQCYAEFVEDRSVPAIDLEKYKTNLLK
jgi:hypothetical protein